MRQLLGIRPIKRLAEFAAVDLRFRPDELLDLLGVVVPPLQMPRAEFPLGVFFIAGTLPVFTNFYFRQRRCGLFRDQCRGRRCLCAGCHFLRCVGCISHWLLISPGTFSRNTISEAILLEAFRVSQCVNPNRSVLRTVATAASGAVLSLRDLCRAAKQSGPDTPQIAGTSLEAAPSARNKRDRAFPADAESRPRAAGRRPLG